MNKTPSEQAEALARQLQEKLRRARPHWVRWVPALAAGLLITLAVLAWMLYPMPEPPRLTVTALDALAVRGEAVTVRACLDPVDAEAKVGSLPGLLTVFWIAQDAPALDDATRHQGVSDEHGQSSTTLEINDAAQRTVFHVRHLGLNKKYEAKDQATIYSLPKDAPLLLVEVEETLADLDPKLWSATNPLNIAVRNGAAAALQAARDQRGYHIVYLAPANTPAKEYRRARGWIDLKAKDGLPRGPVLGRLHYDSQSVREARQAVLDDVRQRFTGSVAAVVRTSEAAEQCVALKIRAIAMGGGDFPAEVARIKGWQELAAVLGK